MTAAAAPHDWRTALKAHKLATPVPQPPAVPQPIPPQPIPPQPDKPIPPPPPIRHKLAPDSYVPWLIETRAPLILEPRLSRTDAGRPLSPHAIARMRRALADLKQSEIAKATGVAGNSIGRACGGCRIREDAAAILELWLEERYPDEPAPDSRVIREPAPGEDHAARDPYPVGGMALRRVITVPADVPIPPSCAKWIRHPEPTAALQTVAVALAARDAREAPAARPAPQPAPAAPAMGRDPGPAYRQLLAAAKQVAPPRLMRAAEESLDTMRLVLAWAEGMGLQPSLHELTEAADLILSREAHLGESGSHGRR